MNYQNEAPWGCFPHSKRHLREVYSKFRVIKTARTYEEINSGAAQGFYPLIEWLSPSNEVYSTVSGLLQVIDTGEMTSDRRRHRLYSDPPPKGARRVFEGYRYYPYQFPSPLAAYLVPKDIQVNEPVWIEDLIEDIPAELPSLSITSCPSIHRIPAGPATWLGDRFLVHYTPEQEDRSGWVG